jgi:hypothetical protein
VPSPRISSALDAILGEIENLRRQKFDFIDERKNLRPRMSKLELESQQPICSTVNPRRFFSLSVNVANSS